MIERGISEQEEAANGPRVTTEGGVRDAHVRSRERGVRSSQILSFEVARQRALPLFVVLDRDVAVCGDNRQLILPEPRTL